MTVTAVRKDAATSTMTTTAEFAASPDRVWELWSDPRQLERWWGPPSHPATVTSHDLRPGGRVEYHLTGPSGLRHRGYWDVIDVDRPHSIVFRDGFANDDGSANTTLPGTESRIRIESVDGGQAPITRMSIVSLFPSVDAMEQLLAMGMEEGLSQAVGQIDAILAEDSVRA